MIMELPKMITNPPIPTSVYKAMAEEEKHNKLMDVNVQQIKLLTEQNEQLKANFDKLEDLYKIKEQELKEAKHETKKATRYNRWMMFFTIIATLVAIAAWLLPNILEGAF